MARLSFLKRTAPTVVAQHQLNYCLVDYSCPEGAGTWLRSTFEQQVQAGRVAVVDMPGRQYFHKTIALNLGGRYAVERGADYICFLDGDTIFRPGLGDWLQRNVRPNEFIITGHRPDGSDVECLMGLLVVPAWAYVQSGGYDEEMHGWGGEDIEMRLRMHLHLGLPYRRVPLQLLVPDVNYISPSATITLPHRLTLVSPEKLF